MVDYAEMQKVSGKHLAAPRPGDYWHEMFAPVCVVIGQIGNLVILCQTTKDCGKRWTWDLEKIDAMSLDAFKKWLSYGSIPGTWADVSPEAHAWVLEHIEKDGVSLPR